ncbi:MAG: VOC family protein [Thermoplasmata archaeon]
MTEPSHGRSGTTLDTVIVVTPRIKELAQFYGEGLGLGAPQPTGDDHLGFPLPNAYLGFDRVERARDSSPGAVSVWFEVDDLQSTFQRFVDLKAPVKYPPTDKPWGARLAAVFDPDGNIVGLSQRRPETP